MIRLRHVAGVAIAMAVAATAPVVPARAQDVSVPAYRMRLLGVYDDASGEPVEGVKVSDVFGGTSTVTGKTGAVSLFFLPEGTSVVRLQKLGFEVQTLTVTIAPTETTPLTMLLHRVVQLPTVVTTDVATTKVAPSLRGFEERARNRRTGYFVTDSTLRKNENQSLADVLRTNAPGVRLAYNQGAVYLAQSPRCRDGTAAGPPQIYVDGTLQSPEGTKISKDVQFDLTRFQISNLAGIEWYPDASLIPIEFAHPSDRCGALFLWTRQ